MIFSISWNGSCEQKQGERGGSRTDMAGATPFGVEIDERVLVAVDLCKRRVCKRSNSQRRRERVEAEGKRGKRGRTYDVAELGDRGNVGDHGDASCSGGSGGSGGIEAVAAVVVVVAVVVVAAVSGCDERRRRGLIYKTGRQDRR